MSMQEVPNSEILLTKKQKLEKAKSRWKIVDDLLGGEPCGFWIFVLVLISITGLYAPFHPKPPEFSDGLYIIFLLAGFSSGWIALLRTVAPLKIEQLNNQINSKDY